MTEDDAHAWLSANGYEDDAIARLSSLVALVSDENQRQNLIAASTLENIWGRHIVDSAQLLTLSDGRDNGGLWVDLGSGGGFPGLVIAVLRSAPLVMIETRGLRANFLKHVIDRLGLTHADVKQAKVERVTLDYPATIISARAFAPLDRTFDVASHLCDEKTLWLLPKGRSAEIELVTARKEWQAVFHVERSVTDPDSAIIAATGLARRNPGTGPQQSARGRKA